MLRKKKAKFYSSPKAWFVTIVKVPVLPPRALDPRHTLYYPVGLHDTARPGPDAATPAENRTTDNSFESAIDFLNRHHLISSRTII